MASDARVFIGCRKRFFAANSATPKSMATAATATTAAKRTAVKKSTEKPTTKPKQDSAEKSLKPIGILKTNSDFSTPSLLAPEALRKFGSTSSSMSFRCKWCNGSCVLFPLLLKAATSGASTTAFPLHDTSFLYMERLLEGSGVGTISYTVPNTYDFGNFTMFNFDT
ncbi:hypothetical protein LXL04_003615 [Taraxacum kok-saghyz]